MTKEIALHCMKSASELTRELCEECSCYYRQIQGRNMIQINDNDLLQEAFDDGWSFLRASEYVPEAEHCGKRRYGYIEYILIKEESND